MPTVTHGKATSGPAQANGPIIRETNLYKVLEFLKDAPKSGKELGHFLGVAHNEQAFIRGTKRFGGLVRSKLVTRIDGAFNETTKEKDRPTYAITEKGLEALRSGAVPALSPNELPPANIRASPVR